MAFGYEREEQTFQMASNGPSFEEDNGAAYCSLKSYSIGTLGQEGGKMLEVMFLLRWIRSLGYGP